MPVVGWPFMETELENLLPFLSFLCFLKRNVGGPIWRSHPVTRLNHVTKRNKPETNQKDRLLANYFQQQSPNVIPAIKIDLREMKLLEEVLLYVEKNFYQLIDSR